MEATLQLLLTLIKSELDGTPVASASLPPLDGEAAQRLYRLSKAHDLAHLCGSALETCGAMPEGEIGQKFQKQTMLAVFRHERTQYEYERICACLEENGIDFVPLKGALIRAYYPEPWMRTSCDIDVLVREEALDGAVKCLCETLGYRAEEKDYHDISLYSESGIHLELHFHLGENVEGIDRELSRVWEYVTLEEGKRHTWRQSNEYLLFHTVAHMVHHFLTGGCGIRPLMDLYLLRGHVPYDERAVRALCATCEIELFYDRIVALCAYWFEGGECDAVLERMERYILSGGVYGSTENAIAVKQSAHRGRVSYVWSRIFPPYRQMRAIHPVLGRHAYLLPVFYVRRWFRAIFGGKMKKSVKELRTVQESDANQNASMSALMQDLGLR